MRPEEARPILRARDWSRTEARRRPGQTVGDESGCLGGCRIRPMGHAKSRSSAGPIVAISPSSWVKSLSDKGLTT
jgi:hypothetical protein